jgi:hypothetical protein
VLQTLGVKIVANPKTSKTTRSDVTACKKSSFGRAVDLGSTENSTRKFLPSSQFNAFFGPERSLLS